MTTYNPDKWLVVKLTSHAGTHYRVFGSWYGGFAGSDSWKLNSGITSCEIVDGVYIFTGHSGSVYDCVDGMYGSSSYAWSVLQQMIEEGADTVTIEVMPEETDFLTLDYS